MDNRQLLLRGLPKIDELLLDEQLVFFMESTPRSVVVDAAREIIDELRREILSGEREDAPEKDELIAEICDRITGKKKRNLRTLINATGVVLHTNLGRSNLCRAAVESVTAVADSYSNLEYDLKKGARGLRHDHVEKIIAKITGAEAAMVVNNNAAATMLCLSAMAFGKEVITSRGELVEIGLETATTAKVFGIDPKVAFLSYSTFGSGKGEDVDKMRNACEKAKAVMPEFPVDGEMQFDAAVSPRVAQTKCPDSKVAGYANTFIFPDINAGNIGYKIAQRLGSFEAYGPILLGLNAPINDLSRGCNAQEVYSMAIITAALAE